LAETRKLRRSRRITKITPLGQVIASRTLKKLPLFEDATVFFGIPRPHPAGDWVCPFVIEEGGKKDAQHAFGIDSVQALQMAFEGARASLDSRGRYAQFESEPEGGPGIQRHIPTGKDRLFEARVILAMERESKAHYGRQLRRRQLDLRAVEKVVKERRKILASLEESLITQRGYLEDWKAKQKEWKPKTTLARP
jgi:hypothetical protein